MPVAPVPFGHGIQPSQVEPGTYAVDPSPFGPPWEEGDGDCSVLYRLFATGLTSCGPTGTYVPAPGEGRNTGLMTEVCEFGCWGLLGLAGPNTACGGCGVAVASRTDDCDQWQELRFYPDAVTPVRVPDDLRTSRDPYPRDTSARYRLGTGPVDDPAGQAGAWSVVLHACAAKILARSDGGLLFMEARERPYAQLPSYRVIRYPPIRRRSPCLGPSGPTSTASGPGRRKPSPEPAGATSTRKRSIATTLHTTPPAPKRASSPPALPTLTD